MKATFYEGNKRFSVGRATPIPPKEGEVRLEVAFCGVCGSDVHVYHGHMDHRVKIPQTIGHEASARIAELGQGVEGFQVGDRVTVRPIREGAPDPSDKGFRHIAKNMKIIGMDAPGAMQSSWTVPAYTLHRLPEGLSLEVGAMIEPLAVACHDVRLGRLQKGEFAVVLGGGPIGMLIALVAREKGAKVIISEVNPSRVELAHSMDFATVNPAKEDITARIHTFTAGTMADLVFEVSGAGAAVQDMTELPNIRGRIVMVAIHPKPRPVDLFRVFWRELQLIGARVYEPEDFEEAIQLAASGRIPLESLITQVNPLDDVQKIFETIDANPAGMKYLLNCSV